jgi:hypothetical protein
MSERPELWGIARRLLMAMISALIPAIALPTTAQAHPLRHQQSSNWAGYAVTSAKPFRSVSGSWAQPAVSCDQETSTYAAFWVGLGGFKQDSRKLEQIGTESDCGTAGRARGYAWYELVPHAPVRIRMRVRPGDRMTARVSLSGDLVGLRIEDLTNHRRFVKTIAFAAPDASSAEWIAEAPSECDGQRCQPLPLTNFRTVQFGDAAATTDGGYRGTLTSPAFTTTALTLFANAPALGPPPPPPPPGAQPASPEPEVPVPASEGGAMPSHPSRHGSEFAVNFNPGNSKAR